MTAPRDKAIPVGAVTPAGWQCPVCGTVYAPTVRACDKAHNAVRYGTTTGPTGIWDRFDSYSDRCSCNPANGGNGVCGCVLGGTQVWC